MKSGKNTKGNENNLLGILMFRFFPYWPVLSLWIVLCFLGAFAYLKLATPTFEATAALLIKDQKKGHEDSEMMESLNVFGSKKIVENEIEVIRSRALMKEVVKVLGLYAPVYREGKLRSSSAYSTAPVKIEVKSPEQILDVKGQDIEKIYFRFDAEKNTVKISNRTYPLNEWVKTGYGELRFSINGRQVAKDNAPMYFSLYPVKKVVTELLKNLNVTAANKLSSVVNLQFVDEVPERAEDILNELINAYNRAGINDKNALAENTLQFVDERLKHVEQELDSVEKQIQTFRAESGAFNLSEQGSLYLKNVGDNDQRLSVLNMQISVLEEVQKYINVGKSKATIVPSTLGVEDPLLSQLLQKLYSAELEYEKLKHTTAENNPLLISVTNEIQRLKPTILENIRVQKINLAARRDQLNSTNKTYSETLNKIPEKERKLLEISRQQAIINNVYNFLLQKREETALSYASTVPDSRVLDVAESSIKPVSPKKIIALPAALVLALVLTVAFVMFKDYISNKIVFRSELETLTDIPVIGEISFARTNNRFIPETTKQDQIVQQIYQIIVSTGLLVKNSSKKKILVTSSVSGEGKSFLSSNLALTLSSSGKKVILVDLDLKNPTISRVYTSSRGPGVSEYLMGEKEAFDVINPTEHDNVFILKAGEYHPNSTALLATDRLEHLFNYLEQSFDFIIIDTAPIDPVTDALLLSQISDTTIFAVRHRVTPKAIIQMLEHKYNLNTLKNVGIVFNGVKPRGFVKGYGYGYSLEYLYKQMPIRTTSKKGEKNLVKQA